MSPMFEPPAFAVPTGDPQRLNDLAQTLAALAEVMDDVATSYHAAAASSGDGLWEGLAGEAFRIRVGGTRQTIENAREQFRSAAAALRSYADVLATAQRRVHRAQADAVYAAELGAHAKARLDLLTSEGDFVSPARYRLLEDMDRATDDIRRAQADADHAAQDVRDAVRRFAGALTYATGAAQAPPDPPPPGATPTETVGHFLLRESGDVFVDPFRLQGKEPYYQGRLIFDLAAGVTLGQIEHLHTYTKNHWLKLVPGTTRLVPVSGYYRRNPSGGKTWVNPHNRTIRTGPGHVEDIQRRLASAKAAADASVAGGGISGGLSALDQWVADRDRPDLDGGDRVIRTVAAGVIGFATSMAGSTVGGAVGRSIGITVGGVTGAPEGGVGIVPGAAVGAVVGGTVGSIYGGGVAQAIGDKLKGAVIK